MSNECGDKFKIVVLGEESTGKKSLIENFFPFIKWAKHGYEKHSLQVWKKTVFFHGRSYAFEFWIVNGNKVSESIRRQFYKGASGVILVFDIAREDTFKSIPLLVEEIVNIGYDFRLILIIGNKKDLRSNHNELLIRETSERIVHEITMKLGLPVKYLETSFKNKESMKYFYDLLMSVVI